MWRGVEDSNLYQYRRGTMRAFPGPASGSPSSPQNKWWRYSRCPQNSFFLPSYIRYNCSTTFTLQENHPSQLWSSGKGKRKGSTQEGHSKWSLKDYRLSIIDILSLEVTLNLVATHHHLPSASLVIPRIKLIMDQVRKVEVTLWSKCVDKSDF